MRKKLTLLGTLLLALTFLLPVTAGADIGPKPSVEVTFRGLYGATYYATLLSDETHYGPWSVDDQYQDYYDGEEAWEAFKAYEDPDGFHFIGYFENCFDTHTFSWTYHPPQTFKILLYFPETGTYAVTPEAYERYAFDTYYTVSTAIPTGAEAVESLGVPQKNYPYGAELFNLGTRVILTLAIELALALAFGFRAGKQLKLIVSVNLVTQILLNLALNLINYQSGPFFLVFHYLWMELAVFLAEGGIYAATLRKRAADPEKPCRPWAYALAANLASFLLGLVIARGIPGIF